VPWCLRKLLGDFIQRLGTSDRFKRYFRLVLAGETFTALFAHCLLLFTAGYHLKLLSGNRGPLYFRAACERYALSLERISCRELRRNRPEVVIAAAVRWTVFGKELTFHGRKSPGGGVFRHLARRWCRPPLKCFPDGKGEKILPSVKIFYRLPISFFYSMFFPYTMPSLQIRLHQSISPIFPAIS